MYKTNRLALLVAALSLTLLSACGQSGALYLPEPEQAVEPQTPASDNAAEQANQQARSNTQ